MNKCLVLVDLQNDYFPGGKMELAGIEAAAENAELLLTELRKTKAPIIHVQHIFLRQSYFNKRYCEKHILNQKIKFEYTLRREDG